MVKEGEKLKRGDERIEITITTKEGELAEVSVDRLREDVEVTPEDMRLAKRAFRSVYKNYVKERAKEMERDVREVKEKEKKVVDLLSPHHRMIEEAIAKGAHIELSLLSNDGGVMGWEPFTHRNGSVKDFHPERFRINGEGVSLKEEIVIKETVIKRPLSTTTPTGIGGSAEVMGEGEEAKAFSPSEGGDETEARAGAEVLNADDFPDEDKNIKKGEYDE